MIDLGSRPSKDDTKETKFITVPLFHHVCTVVLVVQKRVASIEKYISTVSAVYKTNAPLAFSNNSLN